MVNRLAPRSRSWVPSSAGRATVCPSRAVPPTPLEISISPMSRPPDRLAVGAQDLHLVGQYLGIGEAVPDIGVLGHQPQRLLLPTATDQDRQRPLRARVQGGEPVLDPGQRRA